MEITPEAIGGFDTNGQLIETAKEVYCTGILTGHQHTAAASTFYAEICLTYGLKTGTGDYHDRNMPGIIKVILRKSTT
jgi:hypothetical protein